MIKTTITPQNNNLLLTIPDSYIGKQIEVLYYATEELDEDKAAKTNNSSRFRGLLTESEGEQYQQYLKQARSEWDRDI